MPDPLAAIVHDHLRTMDHDTFEDLVLVLAQARYPGRHAERWSRPNVGDRGVDIAVRRRRSDSSPLEVIAVSTETRWAAKARRDAAALLENLAAGRLGFRGIPRAWSFVSSRDVDASPKARLRRARTEADISTVLGGECAVSIYGEHDLTAWIREHYTAVRTPLATLGLHLRAAQGPVEWAASLRSLCQADLPTGVTAMPVLGHVRESASRMLTDAATAGAWHLLVGDAGTGKTGVLTTVVLRLLREEVPVLYIAGRRYGRHGVTVRALSDRLAIDVPLLEVLSDVRAAHGRCVIVVDQLEQAGGDSEPAALCNLLRDAHTRGVSVLAATQSRSADESPTIAQMGFKRVQLDPLSERRATSLLVRLGLVPADPSLVSLARNMLQLSWIAGLYTRGVDLGRVSGRVHLWEAYRREFLGADETGPLMSAAIGVARATVEGPRSELALAEIGVGAQQLASVGVLSRSGLSRYSLRHDELAYFLYAWDAVHSADRRLFSAVAGRMLAWRARSVLRWMYGIYDAHGDQDDQVRFVSDICSANSPADHLARVACLELVKGAEPSQSLADAIAPALADPQLAKAFFLGLADSRWLRHLVRADVFSSFPEPVATDGGAYFRASPWPHGAYLRACVQAEPKLVRRIIRGACTENWSAVDALAEAAALLPVEHLAPIVPNVVAWLGSRFRAFGLSEAVGRMADALAATQHWREVGLLLRALFRLRVVGAGDLLPPRVEFAGDAYAVQEAIGSHLQALASYGAANMLVIFERLLSDVSAAEGKGRGRRWDGSCIWREQVADPDQDARDDPRDLIVSAIVTCMRVGAKGGQEGIGPIMLRYLSGKHVPHVLTRVALHILSEFPEGYPELVSLAYRQRGLLFDHCLGVEAPQFVAATFGHLRLRDRDAARAFIQRVLKGGAPSPRQIAAYASQGLYYTADDLRRERLTWRRDHLNLIREQLDERQQRKLDRLIQEFGGPHDLCAPPPSLVSWVGPTSPYPATDLAQQPVREVARRLREFVPPPRQVWPPPASTEGLAQALGEDARQRPDEYSREALAFLPPGMLPIYVGSICRALEEVLGNGMPFAWPPVLELCEAWACLPDEAALPKLPEERGGCRRWVKRDVVSLLAAGLRQDSLAIPREHLPRVRKVLLHVAANSVDPTPGEERRLLEGNGAPDHLAINNARSLAVRGLIRYAHYRDLLRRTGGSARQAGQRSHGIDSEVLEALERRLDPAVERSLAVRSVFGDKLAVLTSLDAEWVKGNLERILPDSDPPTEFWWAAWASYLKYGDRLYPALLPLLRRHYERAIDALRAGAAPAPRWAQQSRMRLAEHVMVMLCNGQEPYEQPGSLSRSLFEAAPDEVRARAIHAAGRWLADPAFRARVEAALTDLWRARVAYAASAPEPAAHSGELAAYVDWLGGDSRRPSELEALITPTIPHLARHYQMPDLVRYLGRNSSDQPAAVRILGALVAAMPDASGIYPEADVRAVLEAARRSGEAAALSLCYEAVNRIAQLGLDDFHDMLPEA